MKNKDYLLVLSMYQKMLCLMQTSESDEGPSAHKSQTHLGKITQVWIYIGKYPKQWNNEIPLWNILMRKTNYLRNEKGAISELVY